MANNPLQKFFRQPKIYISLPSHGIYNQPGTIQGDVESIPVFGMTGMDEILTKTPDALLTGESTVRVIESCCASIKDAWDLSSIDADLVITSIRIATYGNTISVSKACPNCNTDHEYDLDLNHIVDHYASCKFDNVIALKDLNVMIRPLNYRQSTDFSLKNFQIQQQIAQLSNIDDEIERGNILKSLFNELSDLQVSIYAESIESVNIGTTIVEEKIFIKEWLENCDKEVMDAIKLHIQKNQEIWTSPPFKVKCDNEECLKEYEIKVDLDLSSFFVRA